MADPLPRAAITLLRGNLKVFVNDTACLPALLAALEPPAPPGQLYSAIHSTSEQLRLSISSSLGIHCSTLRDAIFHCRLSLPSSTVRKLNNINTANSFLRHTTTSSLADLLEDVSTRLAEHKVPNHRDIWEPLPCTFISLADHIGINNDTSPVPADNYTLNAELLSQHTNTTPLPLRPVPRHPTTPSTTHSQHHSQHQYHNHHHNHPGPTSSSTHDLFDSHFIEEYSDQAIYDDLDNAAIIYETFPVIADNDDTNTELLPSPTFTTPPLLRNSTNQPTMPPTTPSQLQHHNPHHNLPCTPTPLPQRPFTNQPTPPPHTPPQHHQHNHHHNQSLSMEQHSDQVASPIPAEDAHAALCGSGVHIAYDVFTGPGTVLPHVFDTLVSPRAASVAYTIPSDDLDYAVAYHLPTDPAIINGNILSFDVYADIAPPAGTEHFADTSCVACTQTAWSIPSLTFCGMTADPDVLHFAADCNHLIFLNSNVQTFLRNHEPFFPLIFPELAPHIFEHDYEPCTIFDDWLSDWHAAHSAILHAISMADRWMRLGSALRRHTTSRSSLLPLPLIPAFQDHEVPVLATENAFQMRLAKYAKACLSNPSEPIHLDVSDGQPCELISLPTSGLVFPMGIGLWGTMNELLPHISVGSILRVYKTSVVGIYNHNNLKHLAYEDNIFTAERHVSIISLGSTEDDVIVSDAADNPTINDDGLPIVGFISIDGARDGPDCPWEDLPFVIVGHKHGPQKWLPIDYDVDLLQDVNELLLDSQYFQSSRVSCANVCTPTHAPS
jgi:hypothetical protein